MILNKKSSVIIIGIIVAIVIAVIAIIVIENISTKSSDPDSLLPFTVDPPPGSWVKCATQGGVCMFEGQTKEVRYVGANGNWFNGTFSQSVECNNTTFGDPDHGYDKSCFYSGTTPTGPWVKCATQHGICSINDNTTVIRYGGANNNWVYGTFYADDAQMIDCSNALFGDPDYGNNKNCFYQGTEPTGPWVPCAAQGGGCSFYGETKTVRYGGDNDNWVYGTFTDGTRCNNSIFGDPDYGNNKNCFYQGVTPSGPWLSCKAMAFSCSFKDNIKYVKYGPSGGPWVYGKFISHAFCNYTQFGDPTPGIDKRCWKNRDLPPQ